MAIPTPEIGLVICYAYLWHHEQMAGHDEGLKDRPAVIVLTSSQNASAATEVIVLPVTHRPPDNPAWSVEIPLPVKRHLGLDDARSWVIVAEGNEFIWPGFDLRKIPGGNRYEYGFLPPRFFAKLVAAFNQLRQAGIVQMILRD